jgi:hypothetical protein
MSQMNLELWELIAQVAGDAAGRHVPKLAHIGIIAPDTTFTSTTNGVTTTLCKVWLDGDPQDAAHKRDCLVPVTDSPASGQMWAVAGELLITHLMLWKRIT